LTGKKEVVESTTIMDQLDLSTRILGRELTYLPRTGSTNDVAKKLAIQGAPEGTVVVTDEQTAGRGRLGRRWLAPAGTCLLCSILFRPNLPPPQTQQVTMLCTLAATDAIKETAGLHVWLKWPNDLIVQSPTSNLQPPEWKKLAGILTETGLTGKHLDYAIIGIGINVNVELEMLPSLDPNATSILAETGQAVDRGALLTRFLVEVEQRYEALKAGKSPHQEWASRLATLGQRVRATTSEETLVGVAESVEKDGALLLRTPDGVRHRLTVGDVSLHR
jgi:BirA family biotin operon repressor/biotin-[acetyl-CoA-carboxylase] ligase